MIALIDGDIICFRVGFTTEQEPVGIAKARVDQMLENISQASGSTEFMVYLSDDRENNFRAKLNPEYKANRTKPAPKWLPQIRQHLLDEWQGILAVGEEADDALGIQQTSFNEKGTQSIICTVDKDLKQIAGLHYNFVTGEFSEVSYEQGVAYFYQQLLIGDRIDNIRGIDGIGVVKAGRIIGACDTEYDMFNAVKELYDNDERLLMNGKMLWIRRKPNEEWEFPK